MAVDVDLSLYNRGANADYWRTWNQPKWDNASQSGVGLVDEQCQCGTEAACPQ